MMDKNTTPTGISGVNLRYLSLDPTGKNISFTTGSRVNAEPWSLDNAHAALIAGR